MHFKTSSSPVSVTEKGEWKKKFALLPKNVGTDSLGNTHYIWFEWYEQKDGDGGYSNPNSVFTFGRYQRALGEHKFFHTYEISVNYNY